MTTDLASVPAGSIVVGVDGSRHAERAVRWAAVQAQREQRRLVVVAVADLPGVSEVGWDGTIPGNDPAADPDPGTPRTRDIADAAVALAREVAPDIEVLACAAVGDPRVVLEDLSTDAHLLVVGSRGRGAIRSLLLGSVSSALVRTAACPVVVCRPGVEHERDGVIVGADGTAESLPVIEFAFAQAALHGRPLTVVHCFWDAVAAAAGFREAAGEILDQPELEELRLVLAQSIAGFREKYPDVDVTLVLRHGLVDEALTRSDSAWDLVVVGRHPMAGLRRALVGSIANAVVERASTTVAVVPETA